MYFLERIKKSWLADPKRFIVHNTFWVIGILLSSIVVSSLVVPQPKLLIASESNKQDVVKSLIVRFIIPPSHKNLKISVEPDMPLSVKWSGGFFSHLSRTVIITPESSWEVDTNYSITFSDLGGVVGFGRKDSVTKQFTTQTVPSIKNISVSAVKSVLADESIKIDLTENTDNFADFFFTLDPPAEFTATLDGNSYFLEFDSPLKQGQEYTLTIERQLLVYNISTGQIERRLEKEIVSQSKFTTKSPALISSFSPQGTSILPTTKSFVTMFSEEMNRQSVLDKISVEPAVAGKWSWQDNKTITFTTTSNLKINTNYSVVLKSGAKAVSGSYTEVDNIFTFKTVGDLRIISILPGNGSSVVKLGSNINILFDQPVIQTDIDGKFFISPDITYEKSWIGNKLIINPTGQFNYHTKYTVVINSGVGSKYGTPLAGNFSASFTTELKKVVLNIPLDKQDRALSCEAAALKMALNYRGLGLTETDIMAIVGYDSTIKNGNVWGDPNVAFVGNIDGSQNSTGYGVHWDPIARAASNWRQAKAFSGWTVSQLAWEIEAGNPVVIWGVLGSAYSDPWYTPGGKHIAAWKGEHVRTLIGYTGSADNPASFIINDPIVGRITWSTNTLKNDWAKFNNSGVVVY